MTVYTAGILSGASGAFMQTMAAGSSVLTGGAVGGGVAASVAGSAGLTAVTTAGSLGAILTTAGTAFVAGAAGSIASQAVGKVINPDMEWSWKQVGLAGLGAGITAGIGGFLGPVSSALSPLERAASIAGRAMAGNAVTQKIAVAAGWQKEFDWKGVTATGIGSVASSAVNGIMGDQMFNGAFGEWGGKLARATVSSMASSVAASAYQNGRVDLKQIAISSFASSLANNLVPEEKPTEKKNSGAATAYKEVEQYEDTAREFARFATHLSERENQSASSVAKFGEMGSGFWGTYGPKDKFDNLLPPFELMTVGEQEGQGGFNFATKRYMKGTTVGDGTVTEAKTEFDKPSQTSQTGPSSHGYSTLEVRAGTGNTYTAHTYHFAPMELARLKLEYALEQAKAKLETEAEKARLEDEGKPDDLKIKEERALKNIQNKKDNAGSALSYIGWHFAKLEVETSYAIGKQVRSLYRFATSENTRVQAANTAWDIAKNPGAVLTGIGHEISNFSKKSTGEQAESLFKLGIETLAGGGLLKAASVPAKMALKTAVKTKDILMAEGRALQRSFMAGDDVGQAASKVASQEGRAASGAGKYQDLVEREVSASRGVSRAEAAEMRAASRNDFENSLRQATTNPNALASEIRAAADSSPLGQVNRLENGLNSAVNQELKLAQKLEQAEAKAVSATNAEARAFANDVPVGTRVASPVKESQLINSSPIEPDGCFVAGTMVWTNTGLKPIEQIRVGQLVLAQPEAMGEQEYRPVERTFVFVNKAIYRVQFGTVDGREETILATPNHPFFVKDFGWKAAESLQINDVLELQDRTPARVTLVEDTGETQTVYNLSVTNLPTYYVGELGVWVHNRLCKAAKERIRNLMAEKPQMYVRDAIREVKQAIANERAANARALNELDGFGNQSAARRMSDVDVFGRRSQSGNNLTTLMMDSHGGPTLLSGAKAEAAAIENGIPRLNSKASNNISRTSAEAVSRPVTYKVPEGLDAGRFSQLVDEFAALDDGMAYNIWKKNLLKDGLSPNHLPDIVHQGSLARGENLWKTNWKRYYEEISGTEYPGGDSHAHHLAEKGSHSPAAVENRQILSDVGLNPKLSRENLTWADNVTGQHGGPPQSQLLNKLRLARGDLDKVINALNEWAEIAKKVKR